MQLVSFFLPHVLTFLLLISSCCLHAQYQVEIVRDSFGVPHIFGKTDADVAYGLAWAQCEDDFETLQWGLMVAKGCLGRHLGIEGARIDYAVQLLRVRKTIYDRYEKDVSPGFKKMLEAGCAAVNRYAREHPEEILVKKAFPAEPADVIAGYMLAQALMMGIDGSLSALVDGTVPEATLAQHGRGSNTLAMNSRKTADDKVYLNINSHQPLEGPLSWYEAHVHSEEGWNCMGSTFHGGISIFHGANEHLGWAHTTNSFDGIDVFQLTPDPKKKNHYLLDGQSHKLETGYARLSVNLAKNKKKHKFILTVPKKIAWSKWGATVVNKKGMFALRLGPMMTIQAAEQWYRMNKARNYSEWMEAVRMQGIGNQNFCYADQYDTIYLLSNASIPIRPAGYNWGSTLPGDRSALLTDQFYPIDSLPQVLNPRCGYVFNTNQTSFQMTDPMENPDPRKIPAQLGFSFDDNNRSRRFYENIREWEDKQMDWNDFLQVKYDSRFPNQYKFLRNYDVNELFSLNPADHPEVADVVRKFNLWDRESDLEDTNAVICYKTLYYAYHNTRDSMEQLFQKNKKEKIKFLVYCMQKAKEDMMKHFGHLGAPLKAYQVHQRGNVELPTDGGPDQWNAKYANEYKDGKVKIWIGESYILLVKFSPDGKHEYWSVSPYGASNKPGSPHYTDQMSLYVEKKLKRMTLDKGTNYRQAERIYKP